MKLLNSSVPGLKYLPSRDDKVPSGVGYLNGRRQIDGAEGLWRIGNSLYDLERFIKLHPGGSEWIQLTRGTDITELFESHHITERARKLLPKYYVREAAAGRSTPLTFQKDGFYEKFKERAAKALQDVDFHRPSMKSNLISDSLVSLTVIFCILAAQTSTIVSILLAALFLCWTTITGHNYFHMRDNFRMYYFDISLMSSKEWRITHVLSHHMFANTLWDYEIYAFEPFFNFLPSKKTPIISIILSPVLWFIMFYAQGIKRYSELLLQAQKWETRDYVPFIIPTLMIIFGGSLIQPIKTWLLIIGISSAIFYFIGLTAAHHHPEIFHDGDTCREDLDWGLMEMDAVRERRVIDDSAFLVLTNFGLHTLHHLLPTVDHSYLPLCWPALRETCLEFNLDIDKFTHFELVKGQFQQLSRTERKNNVRQL